MKHLTQYIILAFACCLLACQDDPTVTFEFSPKTPRAGEKVSFSNLTDEGEDWKWDFGDGGTSTVKSPTKVYREPGTYTVTLIVDEKKYRTCTKTIEVRDTIPTIACSLSTIPYYTEVTFSAKLYNPYDKNVTYKWYLPTNAVVTAGDSTTATITAFFPEQTASGISVKLDVTIGDGEMQTCSASFALAAAPYRSLAVTTTEGEYLEQHIYVNGRTEPTEAYYIVGNITPYKIFANAQRWFMLNTNNAIESFHGVTFETIHEQSNVVITACYPTRDYLYYATTNQLYSILLQGSQETLFASSANLTDFPTTIHAIAQYTNIFYLATDQGVYRFTVGDFNTGKAPLTPSILTDYAITELVIDEMARKLYFIANQALYVSHIDGSNPNKLANSATAISIDNTANCIYFATAEGLASLPLIQSQNNQTTAQPTYVNSISNIISIASR